MTSKRPRLEEHRQRWRQRRASQPAWYRRPAVDLRLARLASIAQVGALFAAIIGFYYTVIPLYEKAALDELIAKREIELQAAQIEIVKAKREAYEQRRASYVSSIRLKINDCSEVGKVFRAPAMASLRDKAVRDEEHLRRITLGVDVLACLQNVLAETKASERLTSMDAAHLSSRLAALGAELNALRLEAVRRISQIPELAEQDPSMLDPVGPVVRSMDEDKASAREKLRAIGIDAPDPETTRSRFEYRVRLTQERVARDYRTKASTALFDVVRNINWPADPAETKS